MTLSQISCLAMHYGAEVQRGKGGLPRLGVYRRYRVSDIEATVYEPVLCLILQGGKTTGIGEHRVELRPGDALLVSHHLPVVSRITEASPERPYTAVVLTLDLGIVRGLYGQLADAADSGFEAKPLSVGQADPVWLAPLARYLELIDNEMDAEVLGPATLREIHYRLLTSPMGRMLRPQLAVESHASRIAKAIARMRADFRLPMRVADLAGAAGMSASSFHAHFRSVTGTTPLQYQKDLRLIEARSLLIDRGQSVSEAAYSVGYESPTHFSRDYSRKFGSPPGRDARKIAPAAHDRFARTT